MNATPDFSPHSTPSSTPHSTPSSTSLSTPSSTASFSASSPADSAPFLTTLRHHWDALCTALFAQCQAGESLTLRLVAEQTLFVRLNHNQVRQNTDVTQIEVSLALQAQGRSVEAERTLSLNLDADLAALHPLLQRCRSEAAMLPVDPHQVPLHNAGASDEHYPGQLLAPADLLATVLGSAQGSDLAGLYAGGLQVRANRNSLGQSHWFSSENFFLDYSLYLGTRAAKGCYSGACWNTADWQRNLAHTQAQLQHLTRPLRNITPGAYRCYLAPRAMADFMGMLGRSALSAAAWKQARSPFKQLAEHRLRLSPLLHVAENFSLGLGPRFNALGEIAQPTQALIQAGTLSSLLVSQRSAQEYGLPANAAEDHENPRALDVAPGSLPPGEVLRSIGTGLYLSNLHYLNWSDLASARVTGMTRYACLWVEGGEIAGPIQDLRWDESLYQALGSKLLALGSDATLHPNTQTYHHRSLGGMRTPGALIDDFTFTL
jgi:predicted Zn-dependent protease